MMMEGLGCADAPAAAEGQRVRYDPARKQRQLLGLLALIIGLLGQPIQEPLPGRLFELLAVLLELRRQGSAEVLEIPVLLTRIKLVIQFQCQAQGLLLW